MRGKSKAKEAFSASGKMLHYNTLLAGMAQRGREREFISDPVSYLDTMRLYVDCSLSERDGKIAQA